MDSLAELTAKFHFRVAIVGRTHAAPHGGQQSAGFGLWGSESGAPCVRTVWQGEVGTWSQCHHCPACCILSVDLKNFAPLALRSTPFYLAHPKVRQKYIPNSL